MPAGPIPARCRYRQARAETKLLSATAFFTAKRPKAPARAATDRMGKARRKGRRLSSGTLGRMATAALRRLRGRSTDGVPKPRNYSDPMPPKGGAPSSQADITAVAAYVWAISHAAGK